MDLTFYAYIFAVIVAITGGSYYFFHANSTIAGSVYLVGSIAMAAFFGSRWFSSSGAQTSTPGVWPPMINVCPDFMSLVTVTPAPATGGKATPEMVCVDTVGIYSGGGGSGSIQKWTPGSIAENTLFHLSIDKTGPNRLKALCEECNAKNVTWEGFYVDGTCSSRLPPVPPGTPGST